MRKNMLGKEKELQTRKNVLEEEKRASDEETYCGKGKRASEVEKGGLEEEKCFGRRKMGFRRGKGAFRRRKKALEKDFHTSKPEIPNTHWFCCTIFRIQRS